MCVAGSQPSQLRRTENLERSLKDLIKEHYRRNPQAEAKFLTLLEKKLAQLALEGRLGPQCWLEKWPHDAHVEGWELWKHYFGMPGLSGSAGEGRLIYLLSKERREIVLLWIYTHRQFPGRPPDASLATAIREGIEGGS